MTVISYGVERGRFGNGIMRERQREREREREREKKEKRKRLSRRSHSIVHPLVPISFTLTAVVYVLPFVSYFAGSLIAPIGVEEKKCNLTEIENRFFEQRHPRTLSLFGPVFVQLRANNKKPTNW